MKHIQFGANVRTVSICTASLNGLILRIARVNVQWIVDHGVILSFRKFVGTYTSKGLAFLSCYNLRLISLFL